MYLINEVLSTVYYESSLFHPALRCGPCFLSAYILIRKIRHAHMKLLIIIDSGQESDKYKYML